MVCTKGDEANGSSLEDKCLWISSGVWYWGRKQKGTDVLT